MISGQLSVKVGATRVVVPVQSPAVVLIVTGPEHVICGFSLSTTVTTNEQVTVEVLFAASVAVRVTVVVPLLKDTLPLGDPLAKPVKLVGLIALPEKVAFHVNRPAQLSAKVGAGIE